jgi:hypothetical protein
MMRLARAVAVALGLGVIGGVVVAQGNPFAVGQTWTGTFQGYGTWTARFTELDGDGDPRGLTTSGPDQRTAGGFLESGAPVFYVTRGQETLYCLSNGGAQSGTYRGSTYRQQGSANPQNTNQPCSFAQAGVNQGVQPNPQGSSGSAATWPPSALINVGVNVMVETRSVWSGAISGKDNQGDWTGRVTNPSGQRGNVYAYLNDDGTYEFQVAYTPSGTTQYEYCTIDRSGARGGGVYTGARYFAANKDADAVADGACRVVIGSGASAGAQPNPVQPNPVQPNPVQPNPVQPNPVQASSAGAVSWPPNFALGQTWRVEITGPNALTLNVNLSEKDRFDSPSGRAGAQVVSMYYSRSQEVAVIEITTAQATVGCKFKGSTSVAGATLTGGAVVSRPNAQSPFQNQTGTCQATLTNSSAGQTGAVAPAPVAPAPVAPAPVAPAPQTGALPNTSVWPVRLEVGQSWRADLQGIGTWTVTFKVLDRDGDPSGDAVSNTGGPKLTGVFYYAQGDNDVRLELFDNAQIDYLCIFERNEINGLTFNGWQYESTGSNNGLRKTNRGCTLTYQGRVALAALLDPLAGWR